MFLYLTVAAGLANFIQCAWRFSAAWAKDNPGFIGLIILVPLWFFIYFIPDIFVSIKPGQGGVLWKRFEGGTVTEHYYEEGFHTIPPWDEMYLYDLRYQQHSKEFEVLSADGLLYKLEVTVRFRLKRDTLGFLHKCVGPNYVDTLVFPEISAMTRVVTARLTPDELYSDKRQESEKEIHQGLRFEVGPCASRQISESLSKDQVSSEKQVGDRYLEIDHVFIRRIILPPKVAEAIENKISQRQRMLEYDYRIQQEEKEVERKRIESTGIKLFQETIKQGLSPQFLHWKGLEATLELAKSPNSKVVIVGSSGHGGLPIILGPMEGIESTTAALPAKPGQSGSTENAKPTPDSNRPISEPTPSP